tara:strand:- start:3566 stop:4885 length:1320 start_codon:yes stop_codon:yes gene_type:complete
MPTLAGINGGSLTADVLGGYQQGQEIKRASKNMEIQQAQEDRSAAKDQAAMAKEAQYQALLGEAYPQGQQGQQGQGEAVDTSPQALAQLASRYPERFKAVNESMGLISDQQKQEAAQFAFDLSNTPEEQRSGKIDARVRTLEVQGRNAFDTKQLYGMPFDEQNQALNVAQIASLPVEKRLEFMKGPKPTSLQQNLLAAGYVEGTKEWNDAIMQSVLKPNTSVNIESARVNEEQKKLAGVQAKRFETIVGEAESASKTLSSLSQLENIDVDSGALAPLKAGLAAVISDLGFSGMAGKIANVGNSQAYDAVSGRLVQDVLNAAKGPQTDDDAKRAARTISNLGDDPKARKFKLDSLRALALRQEQRGSFISNKIDEGATFSQANKEWNDYTKSTPNLSGSIKNQSTGLPLFFYQFEEIARQNKPNATAEEIQNAWRKANGR